MNWNSFLNWFRALFGRPDNNSGGPVSTPAPSPQEPSAPVVPEAPVDPVSPPERPPVNIPPTTELPQEGVKLGFAKLWDNHPNISHNEMQPCRRPDSVPNFANQCAIRMGSCLTRSNLLNNYDGVQCWFGHGGQGHTLRARELATWLRNHGSVFGQAEIKKDVTWQDYVNRTGIIYCQNFWGENNQGDHIDLWDGTGEFMGSGSFSWEGPAMASGGLDYIDRSEEVWFWPVH
ncbi:MAG: T6SS effector amidase Tae4 family protein [Thiolinea sp.]